MLRLASVRLENLSFSDHSKACSGRKVGARPAPRIPDLWARSGPSAIFQMRQFEIFRKGVGRLSTLAFLCKAAPGSFWMRIPFRLYNCAG